MISSILIALLQAVAGDPAATTDAAPPVLETAAPAATEQAPPRTERRRVCETQAVATGGRLPSRRCHWEDVPVETSSPDQNASNTASQEASGGAASALAPAPH